MDFKYQQQIHEAFAEEVLIAEPLAKLKAALADNPELLESMKANPFNTAEVDAITKGNVELCEYFALKSEEGKGLEFSKGTHVKDVVQTVRANVQYYKNLVQFISDEKEKDYSKIYEAIKTKLDAYFKRAAEDILNDVYGDKYKEFHAKKYAELTEKYKKNSSTKNKKKDEEQTEESEKAK